MNPSEETEIDLIPTSTQSVPMSLYGDQSSALGFLRL